jgi:origin recognition complex subunit 1
VERFQELYPAGVKKSSRDHGKVFVCRRGCNTRTTTYTPEFTWEDVYNGADDTQSLVDLVESQTKATRKGASRPKKQQQQDLDDFVEPDSDDEGLPKTPRKRRRLNDATTPTSTRKSLASRKFLTPTHKRIVIKKQLEFTPLGTRVLDPSALNSPFQIARNQLHVSSVPAALPCREEEFSTVYSHLEAAITDGSGSCIYISGTPGTGKTATVREVVAQLQASVQAEELDDFIFVEINGMKVTDPHQSYSLLWQALRGDRVSPSHALELLEREFSTPSPRRVPCVVLMDELDQLVTKNQSVMYNFFNWPGLRHSRLIVLAVANTMDLPERTLSNKISSRLGTYQHSNPPLTPRHAATRRQCTQPLSVCAKITRTRTSQRYAHSDYAARPLTGCTRYFFGEANTRTP